MDLHQMRTGGSGGPEERRVGGVLLAHGPGSRRVLHPEAVFERCNAARSLSGPEHRGARGHREGAVRGEARDGRQGQRDVRTAGAPDLIGGGRASVADMDLHQMRTGGSGGPEERRVGGVLLAHGPGSRRVLHPEAVFERCNAARSLSGPEYRGASRHREGAVGGQARYRQRRWSLHRDSNRSQSRVIRSIAHSEGEAVRPDVISGWRVRQGWRRTREQSMLWRIDHNEREGIAVLVRSGQRNRSCGVPRGRHRLRVRDGGVIRGRNCCREAPRRPRCRGIAVADGRVPLVLGPIGARGPRDAGRLA